MFAYAWNTFRSFTQIPYVKELIKKLIRKSVNIPAAIIEEAVTDYLCQKCEEWMTGYGKELSKMLIRKSVKFVVGVVTDYLCQKCEEWMTGEDD